MGNHILSPERLFNIRPYQGSSPLYTTPVRPWPVTEWPRWRLSYLSQPPGLALPYPVLAGDATPSYPHLSPHTQTTHSLTHELTSLAKVVFSLLHTWNHVKWTCSMLGLWTKQLLYVSVVFVLFSAPDLCWYLFAQSNKDQLQQLTKQITLTHSHTHTVKTERVGSMQCSRWPL